MIVRTVSCAALRAVSIFFFTMTLQLPALAHLPEGFVLETYAENLNRPVDLAWSANGLLFVAEKSGTVAVVDDGVVEETRFINIRDQVNRDADRGLLGIAVHPQFPTQPYLYLLHVYDPPETAGLAGNAGPDGKGQRVSRLVRVTADSATDYKTAIPGSELVLLGKASTWANIGDPTADQSELEAPMACGPDGAFVEDCVPADGRGHAIGTVTFGPDGMLYVGNGDARSWTTVDPGAVRALRVDSLGGKILRIDPDTGAGLDDNPYWDGNPDSNRSKVYHLGLRNPYRFTLNPADGKVWVADVGWEDWEEVNVAEAGADFGWPCYEGGNGGKLQQPGYASLASCQSYYADDLSAAPVYSYLHRPGLGGSVITGEFYTANKWPAEYQGSLLLADYSFQELSILRIEGDSVSVTPFADDVLSVDLAIGPDGDYYSANVVTDSIERIRYTGDTGTGEQGTVVASFVSDFTGPVPAAGWAYSWNENGELGSPASESPLFWNGSGRFDSDGLPGSPDATSLNFGYIGPGKIHPGLGSEQGEAADRFVIASYTVSQEGNYAIRNGTLTPSSCEFTNGVELAILVDDQSVHQHAWTETTTHEFSEELGGLQAGTTVKVALGPNGNDGCDRVDLDWDLVYTPGQVIVGETPVVSIDAPMADRLWRAGELVSLSGSAVDAEDGPLGESDLRWEGTIVHNAHFHPDAFLVDGSSGEFEYPDHGDNSYVQLCLIATDSDGQRGESCVDARPQLVTYSFESDPGNLPLTYNGESDLAPFSVELPVGGERLISAPWLQVDYVFDQWSIGGRASQSIVVGDADQTLTASYTELPGDIEEMMSSPSMDVDDAEESAGGVVEVTSASLELVRDADDQIVGLRFPGVQIEPGSVIAEAYIQFTAAAAGGEPTTLSIKVEDSDNAAAFAAVPGDISGRNLVETAISWSPTAWISAGDAGIEQRTPNLAEALRDVINRPGWQSGNALGFVISGQGQRIARAFDDPAGGAPMLIVNFASAEATDPDPGPVANNSNGGGGGGSALSLLGLLGLSLGLALRRRRV